MGMLGKGIGALLLGLLPLAAAAQDNPVVIELFTSQGCSSCPPADEILAELATRGDVIPLALHVDYWDYIGWKDEYADPRFTRRQHNYAVARNERTVYTPQFIVGGTDPVVGAHPMQVMEAVARHAAAPDVVSLSVDRNGGKATVTAERVAASAGPLVLQLVRYAPERTVDIGRGENAGRTIRYVNVVTSWQTVGEWSGAAPLRDEIDISGGDKAVVILQEAGFGRIVAVARAD